MRFRQMLRRNVGIWEILPKKAKGVVSVGWMRQERGSRLKSRCLGHGGDARDGFVDIDTTKRTMDGLKLQLHARLCVYIPLS
jgi:hypothetical protein